jgi:hypothetical protein
MLTHALPAHTRESWTFFVAQLRTVFPAELLQKRVLLLWECRASAGRITKVPHPTYDKPEHYLTFEAASIFRFGIAGLGVANVQQGFTIIDVDSTEVPPAEFSFGQYWERSPSGRGLRSFLRGRLPEGGPGARLIHGVEVYRDKWATVTGDVVVPGSLMPLPAWLIQEWEWETPALRTYSGEPGPWDLDMLRERLTAWKKYIPGFDFQEYRATSTRPHAFAVPCPGETGWPDGNRHSEPAATLSPACMSWIENGLPIFHCFHAHCSSPKKTWKDFQNFYDPHRLWHTVEQSLENYILRLQGDK